MANLSKKRLAIIVVGIVVFAAIIVPIAYYATRSHKREDRTSPTSAPGSAAARLMETVNCVPEADGGVVVVSKALCEKRNCKYYTDDGNGKAACVFPSRKDYGFSVKGKKKLITTNYGYKVYLESKGTPPFDSPAFKNPYFEVEMREENVIRFKFDDEGEKRYKVPKPMNLPSIKSSKQSYSFTVTDWENFAFKIARKSTGTVLFDTSVGGLTLTNQFLQLSTRLPSKNIYGFGENLHHSFRHDLNYQSWPMFSRDQPPRHKAKANLYGVHPFYTCVEDDGNAHGVLLLNSNAQDYSFTPLPMLSYRTIGGILDLYMFLGPSPENVVQQYTKAIGRSFMPPYWAFGFSLSRYGYNSLDNLKAAVKRTKDHGIPQDVQYADIDHMNNSMDFTIDMDNFSGMNETFTELREGGMRTVIMLDPCFISNVTGYEPYERLRNIAGAVMWPDGEGTLDDNEDKTGAILGYVWPQGKTVFPDFFKNKTRDLWKALIQEHRKKLIFDGLWIDMNEPANFGTNQPKPFNWPENVRPYWSLKCPVSDLDDPPYRTMAAYIHDMDNKVESRLSNKTLCMVARQGTDNGLLHYNVHSLFGWSQSEPTLQALRSSSGERSMVLSRSTFPGSGQFVGHWLGDNDSEWPDLADSVIGMLEFNLFGIPFIGSDICGFFGNTTAELCKRWTQLGAFYPFSRNHNGIGYNDQDPGSLGEDVARAAREALETRYWLLPYLYTLFHNAHVNGDTVVRPLHHEFPTDPVALGVDRQFLWGKALLISPILEKGQTKLEYYLPAGRWYDFYTGTNTSGPKHEIMTVDGDTAIRLHVRGGSILPMQKPARNTTYSRKNGMKLLVTLDADDTASGTLFWDDGVSIDTFEKGDYSMFSFDVENKRLRMRIVHNRTDIVKGLVIDVVQIHGIRTQVDIVVLEAPDKIYHEMFHFDNTTKTLLIENLTLSLEQEFSLMWADDKHRIDCYPEELGPIASLTEERCRNRSCIYKPSSSPSPDCYYPKVRYGYRAGDIVSNEHGWAVNLTWNGIAPFPNPIKTVTFYLEMMDNNALRFKLEDPNSQRYKVPFELSRSGKTATDPRYEVVITNKNPFSFQIKRRSTGTVLWDTSVGGLTFEDQFLQIATKLPSKNIYGFGENVHGSLRHNLQWQTWPMFARDEPTGGENHNNHYGVHPYYMCTEDDGHSHGVLLLNSNAQEYSFTPLPMLIYRTIGGIFDFYMFLGPEPENVVQQYTEAVGRPYMPPYWSLGFQLSRYGYNNLENMKTAVKRTKDAGIPQDVQYADIDHMDSQMIFTVDPVNFAGLKEYFDELHSQGIKTVIILDPCMAANDTYEPYQKMSKADGNIKWPEGYPIPANSSVNNGTLLGYVWPNQKVVFPDFFKNSTKQVWESLIVKHYNNTLRFNGLWIDMNEPANFGTNLEKPWNWPAKRPLWSLKCREGDHYDDPPYRTMAAFLYDNENHINRISDKTICMVAKQGNYDEFRHYDVHSLYGWSQTKTTLDGLRKATGKRGIVVTRSTFPGSGHYAGHWLGDNNADWDNARLSVIGILESNMFGIPYIGADVCGFFSNTTADLCKRWMQLGAFYTFYRNHNGIGYIDQDPAVFNNEVTKVSREAVLTRYWLLPYLYTLFHHAHVRGNTVIRPLHHEFPNDENTWGIDKQFLWGPALLISPILDMETTMSIYIPSGTWYDYYTGEKITNEGQITKTLSIEPETPIPLHIRGGHIIPMQEPSNNTYFSRQNNMTLKVALQSDDRRTGAAGDLFWDDGESIDTYINKKYHYIKFRSTDTSVNLKVLHSYPEVVSGIFIENIHVMGLNKKESEIRFVYIDGKTEHVSFKYHESNRTLVISKLAISLDKEFTIEWGDRRRQINHTAVKIDCFPDIDKSDMTTAKNQCERRGCRWNKNTDDGSPQCYIDNSKHGYTISMNRNKRPENGVTEFDLRWKNSSSMFNDDIVNVKLKIFHETENILRLKFVDADHDRYEVPVPLNKVTRMDDSDNYIVDVANDTNGMFYLKVKRNSTGTEIWDTSIGGFTYSNQFLQIAVKLPSKNMYGLGENRHLTFRHDFNYKKWPLFARDNAVNGGDYANLYGVHPFYMNVEDGKGNSHGVLLLNSNAMEVVLQPTPAITYRTIGGILDFYIFLGPEPENVIQQYTSVIGHTYLPPYWSLGFQLCKYGYNNLDNLRAAFQRTIDAEIPFDVQYADIDHMDERMDFTWDPVNFKELPEFVHELHEKGMRFISILDPALISNVTNYPPYDKGIEHDVFIKWPEGKKNPDFADHKRDDMYGYVWPKGKVVFPDFLKPATREYWKDLIVNHYKNISYDGLWIDMNEPTNFGTNEEKPFNWPAESKPYWSLKCPHSPLDDPPYKPRSIYGSRLSDKTLCMVAKQNDTKYNHYDVHSLYGWSETEPTLYALRQATPNNRRGIVISRSTYPSSGRHAGHWLGDNNSKWSNLHDSVIGIMEFNLFGIAYTGADICGFFGDSNAEMCQRWMQLGAFYTFTRNHNAIDQKPQDPAFFGPAVADSSKRALRIRYSLLPYLYTLFYRAHTDGGTVIRSLMHNFPDDSETLSIDNQFMWGSGFMIAPVLEKGKIQRDVYFPKGVWYDYYTGEQMTERANWCIVDAPRDHIPLFIRGGYILPIQTPANTTKYSRLNSMGLIIALNENGTANGDLFWDDGESIDTISNEKYFHSNFKFENKILTYNVTQRDDSVGDLKLDTLTIYGLSKRPTSIVRSSSSIHVDNYTYNVKMKTLKITGIQYPLSSEDFTITIKL